jgi:phosphate-selective porin OprO and OprP
MKKLIIIISIILSIPAYNYSQGCMGGGKSEGVTVSGYFQPQWELLQTSDSTWKQSFTFERARFGFYGNIPYDISYYAFLETSAFKGESPFLLDAFISYTRFSPYAKISIGSFKSPYSLEQNTGCHALHTVKRSKVVQELGAPDRDLGIMISGGNDTTLIDYSIALLNGTGLGNFDDNGFKDVAGRLVFKPFSFLKIGGSFRYGEHPTTVPDSMITPETPNDSRLRWAAELEVKYDKFLFQAEYLMGNDKGSTTVGGGCGGVPTVEMGTFKKNGFFAQALYMTKWNFQPVYKFEMYDSNMDKTNDKMMTQTIGFNYFINEWTRIQANYQYSAEETELPNDAFYLQVQVKF